MQKEREEESEGDFWRHVREVGKQEHRDFVDRISPIVQEKFKRLEEAGHTVKKLTEWQYRIDGRWDIFWQSKRFHDIKLNVRGDYRDIMQFMHVKA